MLSLTSHRRAGGPSFFAILFAYFTLVFFSAAGAKTLVLQSTGPSAKQYPPGRVLLEPLNVTLESGDRISLLDAKGTREIRGPATIRDKIPRTASGTTLPTWGELIGSQMRPAAAAVRGSPNRGEGLSQAQRPSTVQNSLWQIDPTVGGDWCIIEGALPEFWRKDIDRSTSLTITGPPGASGITHFQRGNNTAKWLSSAKAANGAPYSVQLGNSTKRQITIHSINLSNTLQKIAEELAKNHCYHQVAILLDD